MAVEFSHFFPAASFFSPLWPISSTQNACCYLTLSNDYQYQHSCEQNGRRQTDGEYGGV